MDVAMSIAAGGVNSRGRGAGTRVLLPPSKGILKQGSLLSRCLEARAAAGKIEQGSIF